MKIGIVLAAVPGYSETFFRNKIQFLQQEQGIEASLFADFKMNGISWKECPVVYGSKISKKGFLGGIEFMIQLVKIALTHPSKTFRLLKMNQENGFSLRNNLKSLQQSVHILGHKLDWIHFGFGTMAIGRENLAKVIGAKMAVSFRGFDIAIYPLKHTHCYDLVWKKVDKVHVISDDLAGLVLANGYAPAKQMKKITPAINTTKFIPTDKPKAQPGPVKIITVARLHWKKGLEYTLDALYLLKEAGIDFKYTIVGLGEEFERLVFAVHQLGLKEHVIFAGKRSPEEVIALLRESDLYIQYSIQEGFCNAVLEAQAMGLLCIVSDAEGLSENVQHEKTGWVVRRRQPQALANKIEEVIQKESEALATIKGNAVRRVKENFNLQKQKTSFIEFYTHELINN